MNNAYCGEQMYLLAIRPVIAAVILVRGIFFFFLDSSSLSSSPSPESSSPPPSVVEASLSPDSLSDVDESLFFGNGFFEVAALGQSRIYDLNNSRVHELRGQSYFKQFNLKESIQLLTLAGNIAENKTVMFVFHSDYMEHLKNEVRKRKKTSLHAFIKDSMNTESKIAEFKRKVNQTIVFSFTTSL